MKKKQDQIKINGIDVVFGGHKFKFSIAVGYYLKINHGLDLESDKLPSYTDWQKIPLIFKEAYKLANPNLDISLEEVFKILDEFDPDVIALFLLEILFPLKKKQLEAALKEMKATALKEIKEL